MNAPISESRLHDLSTGKCASKNLMEALKIDLHLLITSTLPDVIVPPFPEKTGIVKKMQIIASEIYKQKGFDVYEYLAGHPSDTVRGWACYLVDAHSLSFPEKVRLTLGNDEHFGVREWAWLALRHHVVNDVEASLKVIMPLAHHHAAYWRRFACEIMRPRGVWCHHSPALRKEPWIAQSLINHLRDDPALYVQLSVGNWLNDAVKDNPDWVKDLCDRWVHDTPTPHRLKIIKRGLRNLPH